MADLTGIDLERVRALEQAENARFVAERPRSMELGERARRSMPRGVPMSWMDDLYEHPPVWVAHGEGPHFTDVDGHTFFAPVAPADGAGSRAADDPGLRALIRVFMANRGVWESGWWLGPTVSVAHGEEDVDRYVELFGGFLAAVT